MGVRRRGKTSIFPLEFGIRNQIFIEKNWSRHLNSDWLIWFLQWQFFADMKLTLHKSQVHSYSVMQWWACSPLMSPLCLQRLVAKVASGLSCCWSLLRNNNTAANLQNSLYIAVAGVWLHETVESTHRGR